MKDLKKNTEERRLKLLTHEGNGLLKPEIVKELTVEFKVSKQTVYNDYNSRFVWQQSLKDQSNNILKVINRYEQLYRKASLSYIQAQTNSEQQKAIYLMKSVNKELADFLLSTGWISKVPNQLLINQKIDNTMGWKQDSNYFKVIEDCRNVIESIKNATSI